MRSNLCPQIGQRSLTLAANEAVQIGEESLETLRGEIQIQFTAIHSLQR